MSILTYGCPCPGCHARGPRTSTLMSSCPSSKYTIAVPVTELDVTTSCGSTHTAVAGAVPVAVNAVQPLDAVVTPLPTDAPTTPPVDPRNVRRGVTVTTESVPPPRNCPVNVHPWLGGVAQPLGPYGVVRLITPPPLPVTAGDSVHASERIPRTGVTAVLDARLSPVPVTANPAVDNQASVPDDWLGVRKFTV